MNAVLAPSETDAGTRIVPAGSARILMCAPDAYGLEYEINDWMAFENQPDVSLARFQWNELYRVLTKEIGAAVELIPQLPGAPDMVFTANAGLLHEGRVLLSRFRHPERQIEVEPFKEWFDTHGIKTVLPPDQFKFEGEGDALFAGSALVAGYLKRSDIDSHRWLARETGSPVLSLELVDGRWYHLDTCFFALAPNLVVFYPGAFDPYARLVIESHFETIEVIEQEALRFACNSVVIGQNVVMPSGCAKLTSELEARGYRVYPVEMSEFMKCGGAAKCLTLFLR